MKRSLLTLVLACAMGGTAFAQAQPMVPLQPMQPLHTTPQNIAPVPGTSQTANLLFDAMMAAARAASTNPAASQAAMQSYQNALQRFNTGDISAARAQAIQALITANGAPQGSSGIPAMRSTIPPPASFYQTSPFPLQGSSVAPVDAYQFVAQARGAVNACRAAHSPNTNAATTNLQAAQQDAAAGRYVNVTTEAKAAIDLCAVPQK